MKIRLTCREMARLVLEGQDRRLRTVERLALRLHLLVCSACPRFVRQAALMRQAMGRWKHYAEGDEPPR